MTTTIKITELTNIGANLASSTVIPVVNMAGTPTTEKTVLGNVANFILAGAGENYVAAAKATTATTANTVLTNAQPNITSTGNLTGLTVSNVTGIVNFTTTANVTLGNVSNLHIAGGTAGQILSTDGAGNLSWASDTTTYGNSNVVSLLSAFGANTITTTGNVSVGNIIGNGQALSGITGANVSGFVPNANVSNTAFSVAVANVSGLGNIATTNYDGNASNVLLGNGTFGGVPTSTASRIANGSSNVNIANENSNVTITTNGAKTWTFDNTGNLSLPGDLIGPAGANFTLYSNAAAHEFIFGDDGTFYAPDNAVLGGNAIYIGPGANTLSGIEHEVFIASSNLFPYVQAVVNNVSDNGSADWVALGAKGGDEGGQTSLGFTSSGFGDANYTITGNGDGYVLVQSYAPGQTLLGGGGNLILATGNNGTTKDIIFGTGGFLSSNIFGRISNANNSFELSRAGATIKFPDSTVQNTAWTGSVATVANGNSNVRVATSDGNVTVTSSGTNSWTFDTTGNLTLPSNTFAINYANGDQVSLGGGGAVISNGTSYANVVSSDGNVVIGVDGDNMTWTFATDRKIYGKLDEDVIIVAVDDGNDSSVRHQVVDDNLDALSQTRLEPGDFYIQFDLDSGGNSWRFDNGSLRPPEGGAFEQFDGNIRMYAMNAGSNPVASLQSVSNQNDPNIFTTIDATTTGANISVYNGGSNSGVGYTWQFANDGRLTFPGTPRIDTDANNFEVQAAEAISLEANTVVNIYTDAGNTTYQWQFGDDGNLTLPDTTGVLANVSITLEANDTGNITGLSLIGDSNANLYAHGNVTIVSDSSNTTATWSFVNTGDIVLPNDVVIGDDGSNGMMLSVPTVTPGTYSDWTFDQSGNLTLPGYLISTINDSLNATGTVQANAALLSKSYNIVTGSNVSPINGVILPANPIAGTTIVVAPRANTGDIKIYPQLGGTIEYGTINDPLQTIANQPGNIITFVATSSTNWITG